MQVSLHFISRIVLHSRRASKPGLLADTDLLPWLLLPITLVNPIELNHRVSILEYPILALENFLFSLMHLSPPIAFPYGLVFENSEIHLDGFKLVHPWVTHVHGCTQVLIAYDDRGFLLALFTLRELLDRLRILQGL